MVEASFSSLSDGFFLDDQPKARRANDWLLQYRKNVTSQMGEDGIIAKLFELIPDGDRWCVEFGAGDGMNLSNTYSLIVEQGWSSIQIEKAPDKFQALVDRHAKNSNVTCLNTQIHFEGKTALDHVLDNTSVPISFDLLSIDIDGNDYHVWDATERYRPKVVTIEFNPTISNQIEFIQPRDMAVQQGASLLALVNLGKRKGYELICATDWNAFFVDQKYFKRFDIQDNSIWQLYRNSDYQTHVFQLFDGTIVVGGCNRLLWHNIELDLDVVQQEIQVLPQELRVFPGV